MAKTTTPDVHAISHRIASKTGADPRSVQKVMSGGNVRGAVGVSIQKELSKLNAPPKPRVKK
jgi:hypothetical protein